MDSPTVTWPVTEIFGPTIQGEGRDMGMPCHFVRFGLCDHRCKMCDSKFSVYPEEVQATAKNLSAADIIDLLKTLPGDPYWVVLTGGNPALWDLELLVDQLHLASYRVAVETQGSFWRDWLRKCDLVTVSPKPPSMWDTDLEKLKDFMSRLPLTTAIKVPVFDLQDDLEFARKIRRMFPTYSLYLTVGNRYGYYISDVVPSTETLRYALLENLREMADVLTKDPDFRTTTIQPQLHVLLYGNERGR